MKIKNDFIEIKLNNRVVTIRNHILEKYIIAIKDNQFKTEEQPKDLRLNFIYLKFDEPVSISEELQTTDFDLTFAGAKFDLNYAGNQIIADYYYLLSQETLRQYQGRKIASIGFGGSFENYSVSIGAVVDTSNYDLYVTENVDLKITRRDIFSTDGIFYTTDNVGMYHLFPYFQELYTPSTASYQKIQWGVLKSIGLGVTSAEMREEYPFIDYETEITQNDTEYEINTELTIEQVNEGLFPALDLYPSTDLFPARIITDPLYPSRDIYPGIDVYPRDVPYQYVQLKYQIYQYSNEPYSEDAGIKALDKYYIISNVILPKQEKIKEKVKYERATL